MAQATTDLPDPDDLVAGSLDDPDQLLSQLAANDIDRLLAGGDELPMGDAATNQAQASDIESELNRFFNELQNAQPAVVARPAGSYQGKHFHSRTPWYLLPLVWIIQFVRISR